VAKAKKTDEAAATTTPLEGGEPLTVLAPIRAAGLVLAAKLDDAKLCTVKRARLVARNGADSPEVARVEEQFELRRRRQRPRARRTTRKHPDRAAGAGQPDRPRQGVDADGKGLANTSVATNDENGKSHATAKTDSPGDYIMRVPAKGEAQAEVSLTATVGKAKPVAHPAALELAANRVINVEMMLDA
jgi:hypothetical protein